MSRWHELLTDQYRSRRTFDTSQMRQRFGGVVVDYRTVQEKVSMKYDFWHKEILYRFGNLLSDKMAAFRKDIVALREQLERQRFDKSTEELVGFVTLMQTVQGAVAEREAQLEGFRSGQRLLEWQRYDAFRSEGLWVSHSRPVEAVAVVVAVAVAVEVALAVAVAVAVAAVAVAVSLAVAVAAVAVAVAVTVAVAVAAAAVEVAVATEVAVGPALVTG